MTTQSDILGRAPVRKPKDNSIPIDGPSFADLCKPISAKVMPRRAIAMCEGGEEWATRAQRQNVTVQVCRRGKGA